MQGPHCFAFQHERPEIRGFHQLPALASVMQRVSFPGLEGSGNAALLEFRVHAAQLHSFRDLIACHLSPPRTAPRQPLPRESRPQDQHLSLASVLTLYLTLQTQYACQQELPAVVPTRPNAFHGRCEVEPLVDNDAGYLLAMSSKSASVSV
jgi:hypothetical protein